MCLYVCIAGFSCITRTHCHGDNNNLFENKTKSPLCLTNQASSFTLQVRMNTGDATLYTGTRCGVAAMEGYITLMLSP